MKIKHLAFGIILFFSSCSKQTDNKKYKIFRYNQSEGLSSLDPAFAKNQGNIWAVSQLFNGLIELDPNMKIIPCLAEKWEISDDGLIYTFYLKKNIHFHDNEVFVGSKGREVKAEDFVYSFKRLLDKSVASPGAWIFNEKVIESDSCIKAVDDYTLKIFLKKPFPPMMQLLAMPYANVVPKEGVEKWGKEFRMHPIGTGPFKFKTWEEDSDLILSKNENYWKNDSLGNKLPYLDAVHVSFISDRNLAFMTFMQGKLEFISGLDENSRDMVFTNMGEIKEEFASKYNVQKIPYLNTEYLGFQLDDSLYTDKTHPLLNLKVRQALNYSIDRKQLVTFIVNNIGTPGEGGMIPVALNNGIVPFIGYNYDLDKAQKLLKEAGYGKDKPVPEIKLHTISKFPYKEMAEYLQREWAKIGIKVLIEVNQVSTHLELVSQGRVNFFRASWLGDYPDPENYLTLFYSKNFSPAGPNKTHYKSNEFDKLYEQALAEQNTEKRQDLYLKMDKMAMEKAPVIILFYDQVIRITQKNIKGIKANAMNSLYLEKVDYIE